MNLQWAKYKVTSWTTPTLLAAVTSPQAFKSLLKFHSKVNASKYCSLFTDVTLMDINSNLYGPKMDEYRVPNKLDFKMNKFYDQM